MTTYKLVIMDAPIWGLGERLEDCIIAVRSECAQVQSLFTSSGFRSPELIMQRASSMQGERALFLACHRLCFAWIDEWYGMTVEQIREMERQTDMLLKKVGVSRPLFIRLSATNLMLLERSF